MQEPLWTDPNMEDLPFAEAPPPRSELKAALQSSVDSAPVSFKSLGLKDEVKLGQLATQFQVSTKMLQCVAAALQYDERTFKDDVAAIAEFGNIAMTLGTPARSKDWAVLHRMKQDSFKEFFRKRHASKAKTPLVGPDEYAAQKKHRYETRALGPNQKLTAKYHPGNWGGLHNWENNEDWLKYVAQSLAKILVTGLPLKANEMMRQTPGHDQDYSAYARELAWLLANGYWPFPYGQGEINDDSVLALYKISAFPVEVRLVIRSGNNINVAVMRDLAKNLKEQKLNAKQIAPPLYSPREMLRAFYEAGIPTELDRGFADEDTRDALKEERQAKAEEKYGKQTIKQSAQTRLVEIAREEYRLHPELTKKNYNNRDVIATILMKLKLEGFEITKSKCLEAIKSNLSAIFDGK
jgi:hypothetical protein